jgi:hypothetical protein
VNNYCNWLLSDEDGNTTVCGRPARFKLEDSDGHIWVCAGHYDAVESGDLFSGPREGLEKYAPERCKKCGKEVEECDWCAEDGEL